MGNWTSGYSPAGQLLFKFSFLEQYVGLDGKYVCLELFLKHRGRGWRLGDQEKRRQGDRFPLPRLSPSGIVNLTQEATKLVAWQSPTATL